MPRPVKLSDDLINAARESAALCDRSIPGQIEHWAGLGRAIERSLTIEQSTALKHAIKEPSAPAYARPREDLHRLVADALQRSVSPEFSETVREEMQNGPRPTYGTHPAFPGYLVRRDPDGTLTPGRLVGRQFIALEASPAPRRPTPTRNPST